MKRNIFSISILAAYVALMTAGGTSLISCRHEANELAHSHAHEHGHELDEHEGHDHDLEDNHEGHEHEGHEGHDHGAGTEITLEPEQARSMGVETIHVHPAPMAQGINASARISGTASNTGTISAPTSGIFTFAGDLTIGSRVSRGQLIGTVKASAVSGGDQNAVAKAALDAARREYDRIKPLFEQRLVTADRYEAARAAYESARAAYSPAAASGRVTAPTAGVITELNVGQGAYVDAGTVIAQIADGSRLTLTAEVPDRYRAVIPGIRDARIRIGNNGEAVDLSSMDGHKSAGSGSVSTTPGYVPVVFTFRNDGRFYPGEIVSVYLLGSESNDVISVPLSAISEQQGNYFVYIKVDDEGYVKSPVRLGARNGRDVEILSGVHAHDEVVVKGVTAVRLAETSNVVPEGHSHSH